MNIDSMVNLRDADLRRDGLFVAEGRLLTERSVASGCRVLGIAADAASGKEALALAEARNIPVSILDKAALERLAGFSFHRGMLAVAERPILRFCGAEAAADIAARSGAATGASVRILVLPAITDPGNLGTLLRSALAFGFDTVLIGAKTCDPFNRKALRASMGASLRLRLFGADENSLRRLASCGIAVLAAAMEEGALVAGNDGFEGRPVALVLGNEHDGIPAAWRTECAAAIRIEVSGEVDSLNVAVAGSILMRELTGSRLP